MSVFAFIGLANGIFALSFGFFLISKSYRDKINRLFFLMTAAIAMWSFGYWQWLSSTEIEPALFWIRFFSIGSLFIPILYFIYIFSFLFVFFSSSSLFIQSIEPKLSFSFWPIPGPLYSFYLVFFYFFLVMYSFILLVRSYRTSVESKRGQIFYVILGAIFGFGGGATNFFLWYGIPIPPYGNFLVSLFPFFLGYAIIKHHLFNVRVIATELLVFSIWVFLLVRTILARSLQDAFLDGGLLVLVIFFGILLIRSVLQEVRSREEISRLADDLRIANVELKKLDQLKSEFLSLATHQLRTPLTITKGYISMIQEGTFGVVHQKIRDVLSKVYLSNERLISLVNDFLNLSRIESGRMKYNFEQMKAEQLVESAVEEFKELAKEKKVDLIWKKPSGALPEVMIDKEKFHQVLMNIIDNAFKYCKEGHIEVSMSEEAGRGCSGKNILIKVKDSGVGMTREELDSIFKKFARAQAGSKVNTEGTGLGLYLAKRIVGDHGGEIWAESEGHGLGSTFKIRLPAKGEEVSKQVQFKEFVEKI